MHHAQRANWGLAGTHIEVWSLIPPPLSSQATWKNMKGAVEADRGQRQTEMGECSMPCKSLHLRRCCVRKESASKHQRQGNDSQARKCKSGNSGKGRTPPQRTLTLLVSFAEISSLQPVETGREGKSMGTGKSHYSQ